jgi:predicted 3-demethylubiquinone-9 3-methyltransferase (glyoxalase superfamily)
MAKLARIGICLWFDNQAEDAAKFYTGIFKNSKIHSTTRYGKAGFEVHKRPAGSVMTVVFELNGLQFTALNGGPLFKFNEAVSIEVHCESQKEVDYYWGKLTAGGDPKAQQCGWLKDKFGVSWQVVPDGMDEMLGDPNSAKSQRAFAAMMDMKKLDIGALKKAYDGK